MSVIISSFLPFPNIAWWMHAAKAGEICFDKAEHFEKMTFRNRYQIAGANGMIQLSIPLVSGRNQRAAMRDVRISNTTHWQRDHWRTLTSVYRRAPYFEHYEHSLQPIFEQTYDDLSDFCLATILWLRTHAGFNFDVSFTDTYIKEYGAGYIDLRNLKTSHTQDSPAIFPSYYQLFEERNNFIPNLSLLDLLFSEGPYTGLWIKNNMS